jgi:hypothetical protein
MFIGGSCFLRVLVVEFEGESCFHQAWRDTLRQQRGSAQVLSCTRLWGGWGWGMEATGLQLNSDGYLMSSNHPLSQNCYWQ